MFVRGFFFSRQVLVRNAAPAKGNDAMSKQPADLQPADLQAADPQPADPQPSDDPESAPGRETALPPFRYDARLAEQIELRWQDYWESAGTFAAANPVGPLSAGYRAGQPKSYVLDMFPYASGTGIHVGHPEGYIATDVYARFLRMTGHHVLHAMGFDSFGLPAEQFALASGQHPRDEAEIVDDQTSIRPALPPIDLQHPPGREHEG